jgi:hypothetical protein
VLTVRFLDEADNGLNENQQVELVSTVMRAFDGVEQEVRSTFESDASTARRVELRAVEGCGA